MEYLLITILQLLGIGFHVAQKIITLGDKFPDEKKKGVILAAFWDEDWDTLLVSFLVLISDLVAHVVIHYIGLEMSKEWYWQVFPFALAFVLGYGGQRIAYKVLGSAEQVLTTQVTDRLNNLGGK
jgi:hypothetical protein